MQDTIGTLSRFLRRHGWRIDEFSIKELYVRHAMPHTLRCISDILDELGIENRIYKAAANEKIGQQGTLAFIPSLPQPLCILENKDRIVKTDDSIDIYIIKINVCPSPRRSLSFPIKHLIWRIGPNGLLWALGLCLLAPTLLCIERHTEILSWSIMIAVLYFGIILSSISIVKDSFHLKSSHGICRGTDGDTCLSILRSDDSKIIGIIPLSIIALSYFTAQLLCVMFCTDAGRLYSSLLLISLASFPTIAYSAALQLRHRMPCALCIGIDGLLLTELIILLSSGLCKIHNIDLQAVILFISVFISIVLSYLILTYPRATESTLIDKHENLLSHPWLFFKLLEQEPTIVKVEDLDFPTIDNVLAHASHRITAFLSPECPNCKKIVYELRQLTQTKVSIVLISANEKSLRVNTWLLQQYIEEQDRGRAFEEFANRWKNSNFAHGEWYPTEEEYALAEKHNEFSRRKHIPVVPYILVDGKRLPDIYDFEDLRYLLP